MSRSTSPGESVCRELFERVLNSEDHARLLEIVPQDFRIDDARFGKSGPVLLVDLINAYKSAVPDLSFRVTGQTGDDGTVTTHWSARGRHNGLGLGAWPTGRRVTFGGVLLASISPTGVVREMHGRWDVAGFLARIGGKPDAFMRAARLPSHDIPVRTVMEHRGRTILLFPAMTLPGWMTWRRAIEVLKDDALVVTFQLISNRLALEGGDLPKAYSLKTETHAIERALKRTDVPRPLNVVGHSAGGAIALDFALDAKRAVRSLTLIEPSLAWVLEGTGAMDPELSEFLEERIALYSRNLTADEYASFLERALDVPGYDPKRSSSWGLLRAYRHNMRFRSALYTHRDRLERLRSVRFPVLLVRGERSGRFHREVIRALEANLPNVRSIELPGGHAPHFGDGMPRFLNELSRFHRECRSQAATATCRAAGSADSA